MDVFFEDCFQKCFTVPLYDVQKRENKTEKSLNRSYIFIEKVKRVLDLIFLLNLKIKSLFKFCSDLFGRCFSILS